MSRGPFVSPDIIASVQRLLSPGRPHRNRARRPAPGAANRHGVSMSTTVERCVICGESVQYEGDTYCRRCGMRSELDDMVPSEGMSERERKIRTLVLAGQFPISAVDTLYLIGVIDVIRADRERGRARVDELERDIMRLRSAVDTIPAAVMLLGGPPYKLTFTESCLKEIAESQK